MSEPMFPSPDQSHAAPATAEVVDSGSSRKALLAIGGIGAALVVGAGAFFLLSSGSSDPVATPVPAAQGGATASPQPAPSSSPAAKPAVRPASASVTSRDPFKPLFVAAVVGDTGTAAGGSGGGAGSGATSGGSSVAAAPAPAPAPAAASVTLTVSSLDSTAQTATVGVDGKSYPTTVNKAFGKYYMVYSVFNDKCAGVLYGDQSVIVCASKPVSVTP